MPKIPRVMSTQHPDNVRLPFFAESTDMSGEDEIKEVYYAFSHLGCDEQMWDCEGKEADAFVVRKFLTRYEHFFKEKRLGQDVFITLRVSNPTVEKVEAKVLLAILSDNVRSSLRMDAFDFKVDYEHKKVTGRARSFGKDRYRLYACHGAENIGCRWGIRLKRSGSHGDRSDEDGYHQPVSRSGQGNPR